MNKIPASSVTSEADIFFLDQAANLFPCNLPFAVLSGTDVEINSVINYPHHHGSEAALNPSYHDWITHYTGPLREVVAVACRAFADKMAHEPMSVKDRLYALRGQNKQARYTKLYAKYFGA